MLRVESLESVGVIHQSFPIHSQWVKAVVALHQVLFSRQVCGSLTVPNGVLSCHEWEECLHFFVVFNKTAKTALDLQYSPRSGL